MKIKRRFYSGIQKILEFIGRRLKKGCNIYMFHQVNDNTSEWLDSNICISQKGFEDFIDSLLAEGYIFRNISSLSEVLNIKHAFITFDDIFSDVLENAVPYLLMKNIPFCVFVAQNYIGKEGYISQEQLQILLDEPLCTVAFHTKNHALMRGLERKDMEYEVSSMEFLEQYGYKPRYFAFPYGSLYACNFFSMTIAKKEGYKYCFSTLALSVTPWLVKHIPFFLPRININEYNYKKYLGREL